METNKFSKIDQLRICFTLEPNKFILSGNKQIRIEIINPKNRLLNFDGNPNRLLKEVYYNRFATDVCLFLDTYQHEVIAGNYTVNVFFNNDIIATTTFKVH